MSNPTPLKAKLIATAIYVPSVFACVVFSPHVYAAIIGAVGLWFAYFQICSAIDEVFADYRAQGRYPA